jgi:hypothetical protein
MKLRDLMESSEEKLNRIVKAIKEKIPEAKDVKKEGKHDSITFTYKDKKYNVITFATRDDKFIVRFLGAGLHSSGDWFTKDKLSDLMNTLTREEAEKLTKEIRNKSVKLPNKKMRLK